ncbi:hypothetical protein [Methanosalsum natronophilum]|nr:hypothetical protein [Methanosalsum natronophilum]
MCIKSCVRCGRAVESFKNREYGNELVCPICQMQLEVFRDKLQKYFVP